MICVATQIILEEAAFVDLQVVHEVVVPLLAMTGSCLLGISTLLEDDNCRSHSTHTAALALNDLDMFFCGKSLMDVPVCRLFKTDGHEGRIR